VDNDTDMMAQTWWLCEQ